MKLLAKTLQGLEEILADELADVLFVTICLANQTGIDLASALQRNLDKKTQRDAHRHVNNPKLADQRYDVTHRSESDGH